METKDMIIIKLGHEAHTSGSERRFRHADIVIDVDGTVVKDRFGQADRPATEQELKLAVAG